MKLSTNQQQLTYFNLKFNLKHTIIGMYYNVININIINCTHIQGHYYLYTDLISYTVPYTNLMYIIK